MQVAIRPMEANLTHDTEAFGRMVNHTSRRTPSAKSTSEDKCIGLLPAKMEAKTHIGTTPSTAPSWAIPS